VFDIELIAIDRPDSPELPSIWIKSVQIGRVEPLAALPIKTKNRLKTANCKFGEKRLLTLCRIRLEFASLLTATTRSDEA